MNNSFSSSEARSAESRSFSTRRPSGAPRSKKTSPLLQKFPELRLSLFGKNDSCSSDQECAQKLGFKNIAKLNQVHGNVIHIVHEPSNGNLKGDGLMTDVPGLALSIRFADCQAFAITVPDKNVIGVVHAGWRGMAAQVITAFYKKLREEFSIEPQETFVYAAPSICLQCAEFWNPTHELPEHLHEFIEGRYVDLQKAADAELEALGVPPSQRERHPACTKCSKGFWSYRGGDMNKRNYLVVGIKPSSPCPPSPYLIHNEHTNKK